MTPPLNVLIPMAGKGKRFRRAGYETYKPFVPIFDKPMIQYVLDAFPSHVTRRIIADRSLLTDEQLDFLQRQSGVVVHFVESHELGPAYSIYAARDELPLDESFFIAYCDIHWTWDYAEIEPLLDEEGVVFTRRSFHPHLVGNNYSAFCKPTLDDPSRLAEIREKGSFTREWMKEPLSIGSFYIRDGNAMMQAIATMIAEDRRVSDEFFPSVIFNDLIRDGHTIRLQDVDFFVHWGVPEQLEDLLFWVRTCDRLSERPAETAAEIAATNICCMGGVGARMRHVGDAPKALMPVDTGEPMYRYVARHFGCRSNTFIVNDRIAGKLSVTGDHDDEVLDIGPPTDSQIATLKRASGILRRQEEFFLTSCDAMGLWDRNAFGAYLDREDPDAVIFTFEPTLLQRGLGGGHTYVEVRDGRVCGIHIKHRPTGEARGLAGFFWFRNGSVFEELDCISDDPDHELCADHVLKYMLDEGRTIGAFALDAYIHLGSPEEFKEFAFWRGFHGLFPT